MKLALVQMPPQPRDTPPFEMALSAAILRRAGHEVLVFDVNNELYHQTYKQRPRWKFQLTDHSVEPHEAIFQAERDRFAEFARAILATGPQAVVLKTENALRNAMNIARLLKSLSPEMPVLASGTAQHSPELVRGWVREQDHVTNGEINMPFDWHILGEDDIALPALLAAIESRRVDQLREQFLVEGRFINARRSPHIENLDELPFYDFRDYDTMRYGDPKTLRFNASRSCIMHCAFCADWVAGDKYRTMSGDRWFEEYRVQHERHPHIQHYQYYDRLLNGDITVLERYLDRLIAHYGPRRNGQGGPPVIWAGDFILRPEMTDALIQKMAQAQCGRFGTGLESGSERVRASVFKGFFTNAVASRIFASCRRHGINVAANIMIGLPGETRADFVETIRFVEDNRDHLWELRLTTPTVWVQPGTPLYNSPARFNLKGREHEKWESLDGLDYAERVRRFEEFCLRMVELPQVRLAVNRRIIKNVATVRRLVDECRQGLPITSGTTTEAGCH